MYVLIYVHMLSVLGPYMSENSDTKVSRHTKNHVAKNWPVGTKIGDISPCRRHVADTSPTFPGDVRTMLTCGGEFGYEFLCRTMSMYVTILAIFYVSTEAEANTGKYSFKDVRYEDTSS